MKKTRQIKAVVSQRLFSKGKFARYKRSFVKHLLASTFFSSNQIGQLSFDEKSGNFDAQKKFCFPWI